MDIHGLIKVNIKSYWIGTGLLGEIRREVKIHEELDNDREAFEHDKCNFTSGSEELRSSDKQLRQMANRNPEASKLRRIERSVVGYDMSTDDIELLNSQEDSNIKDESSFDPYTIIRSGFRNSKLVDEAMLHLHLKGGFKIRNEKLQNSEDIFNKFRPTCKNDNDLIQKWQETIVSRKRTEP
ncbi:10909_t:CDS:2, partial [Cetraspora pellucida]